MASVDITIKKGRRGRRVSVSFDADRFEKIAADFGLFNPDFLRSIANAERDIKAGKIRRIPSLKSL